MRAYGFRQALVFENAEAGKKVVVDNYRGAYLLVEVTNSANAQAYITINDNPEGGHSGVKIPVPASSTRVIPMAVYSFTPSAALTVVAYGM